MNLLDCSGELDQSQHILHTKVNLTQDDIPTSRDPSWPAIEDPGGYEAAAENVLVVERRGIDADGLRFTDFSRRDERLSTQQKISLHTRSLYHTTKMPSVVATSRKQKMD